jgi:formate hydrogenlyase subunit 6/NADH:ubiquinone oxidoreductase subunit I
MKVPGKMLREVLSHVGKAPATVRYPLVLAELPDRFRGQVRFVAERCVGCGLCEKDCPAAAIEIREVAKKVFEALFLLDRCIYCAQCVLSCKKSALETTPVFELAALDRTRLKVVFRAQSTDATNGAAPAADRAAEPTPEE